MLDRPVTKQQIGAIRPAASNQILHRAGDEHLSGTRLGCNARRNVDCDASDAVIRKLDPTRV
jgi:hypothetical protein